MITVSGLTKKYGDRTVVDDVSFTLEPGTVTGFLGPNGAGKTTTMRMMTGLVAPTAGGAGGRPPLRRAAQPGRRRRHPARRLRRAPRTHRPHAPAAAGADHRRLGRRVDEVLDLVGLTDAARRRIGGYSLGMRQRLGIAGALLADPPVLIFDEPANGLDPEGIRWMRDLLRGHAARGGTVLLSSHLLGEVEHTVDRLLVIGNGRIVADGPVAELLGDDGHAVRAVDPAALARDLEAAGFHVQHGADGVLVVPGTDPSQVGAVAAAGGHVLVELRPSTRPRGPVLPAHHRGMTATPTSPPGPRRNSHDRRPDPRPPARPAAARRRPPDRVEIRKSLSTRSGKALAAAGVRPPAAPWRWRSPVSSCPRPTARRGGGHLRRAAPARPRGAHRPRGVDAPDRADDLPARAATGPRAGLEGLWLWADGGGAGRALDGGVVGRAGPTGRRPVLGRAPSRWRPWSLPGRRSR